MIFKSWYDEFKTLRDENKYYSRECFLKEKKYRKAKNTIKELNKKIEELGKEIEVLKNEKKPKRKNTTVSKRLQNNN
jgi:SMC interacting uncharacterized protein involved in chromosome segregation